jgi:hypothetical protein
MSGAVLTEEQAQQIEEVLSGMLHGTDWNNGTHSKMYRPKFPEVLATIRAARAQEQSEQEPVASSIRGFSLWLDREAWGHVIDGLMLERERSAQRKAANPDSNSNYIANRCAELIAQIGEAATDIVQPVSQQPASQQPANRFTSDDVKVAFEDGYAAGVSVAGIAKEVEQEPVAWEHFGIPSVNGKQAEKEPLMDYERINALREGEQNGAEDAYFFVRPENDTPSLRKMFCQGFERGFHKGLKYAAPVRTKGLGETMAEYLGERLHRDSFVRRAVSLPEPMEYPPVYPDESRQEQSTAYQYRKGWNDCLARCKQSNLSMQEQAGVKEWEKLDLKLAASRFLGWKLPKDFQPDGGIRFATNYEYESPHWPVGTNLLTYEQAVAMLEHCLEDCMESVVAVPKGYRLLKDSTIEERSWPADSAGENGNYYNTCSCCQRQFVGYKRRSMCKVCSDA